MTVTHSNILYDVGHIYKALGPTKESKLSVYIGEKIMSHKDRHIQFIDDVHEYAQHENKDNVIEKLDFEPHYTFNESDTIPLAHDILSLLREHAPHQDYFTLTHDTHGDITLHTPLQKKIKLTQSGNPTCVLMDSAFTLIKHTTFGFSHIINILHRNYKQQQEKLHAVIETLKHIGYASHDITLGSILFREADDLIELFEYTAGKWIQNTTIPHPDFLSPLSPALLLTKMSLLEILLTEQTSMLQDRMYGQIAGEYYSLS